MELLIYLLGYVLSFIVGVFVMKKVGGEELSRRDIEDIMMYSLLSFLTLFFFSIVYWLNRCEKKKV